MNPCSDMSITIAKLASKMIADGSVKNITEAAAAIDARYGIDAKTVLSVVSSVGRHAVEDRDYAENVLNTMKSSATPAEARRLDEVGKAIKSKKPRKKPRKKDLDALRRDMKVLEDVSSGKLSRIAKQFERAIVAKNPEITREELLDAVHAELDGFVPGLVKDMTMDALGGYGLYTKLPTDTTSTLLRKHNGEYLALSKLREFKAGRPAMKTGMERNLPSDFQRTTEAEAEKRKGQLDYKATPEQLRSKQDQILRYLEHRIADLGEATKPGGKPIERGGVKVKTNPEIEAARAEVKRLNAIYQQLHKKPVSNEARINAAIAATQRSMNMWKKKMDGTFKAKPKIELKPNQKLKELRANRDRIKEAYFMSDKAPSVAKAFQTLKELKAHYDNGTLPPPKTKSGKPMNQHLASIRDTIDAYRKGIRTSDEAMKKKKLESIERLWDRLLNGDFAPPVRQAEVPKSHDLEMLEFREKKLQMEVRRRMNDAMPRKWYENVADWNTAIKFMTAAAEFSMVLRQNVIFSVRHPVKSTKYLKKAWDVGGSDFATHQHFNELNNRPEGGMVRRSGVFLSDNMASVSQKDELLASAHIDQALEYLSDKPGIGKYFQWLKRTERMYMAFLNEARFNQFVDLKKSLNPNGSVEDDQHIAHIVNVFTGRGGDGIEAFDKAAQLLNGVMFAPRFVLSRFQIIGMVAEQTAKLATNNSTRQDRITQKIIAGELGGYVAGIMSLYGMMALGAATFLDDDEWDLETNPMSSDFLKFRIGNTRIDPWGGLQQAFVFTTRMSTMHTKSLDRPGRPGEVKWLFGEQKKFGDPSYPTVIGRFMRSKLAPIYNGGLSLLSGEDYLGRPQSRAKAVLEMTTPMAGHDIVKALMDQGMALGAAESVLVFLGMGLQVHEPFPVKQRKPKLTE